MSRFSLSRVDAAAQLDQGDGGGNTATPLNLRRVCAFATFSGAYAGCFQHFMYNIVFFKLFGELKFDFLPSLFVFIMLVSAKPFVPDMSM